MSINNHPILFKRADDKAISVIFTLNQKAVIEINNEDGIAMLPNVVLPKPNYTSEGLRILNERIDGNQFIVAIQGLNGSSGKINLWNKGKIETLNVEFNNSNKKYVDKVIKFNIYERN